MNRHYLFCAAILGLAATTAQGATCAKRDTIVDRLHTKYSEQLSARGLQSADALLEVFTSDTTGTYTVLLTNPQGVSCIVGSGTAWHAPETVAKPAGTAS